MTGKVSILSQGEQKETGTSATDIFLSANAADNMNFSRKESRNSALGLGDFHYSLILLVQSFANTERIQMIKPDHQVSEQVNWLSQHSPKHTRT